MCGFEGARRGNYFWGRASKYGWCECDSEKAASRKQFTGEMIRSEGKLAIEWIWKSCNISFESRIEPDNCSIV